MRLRALVLILGCLMLLAGCDMSGLPTPPTPTPEPIPTAEPSPTTRAVSQMTSTPRQAGRTATPRGTAQAEATVQPSQAELQQIAQVEEDAAELRGLQPKEDVPETFLTQEQLRANLMRDIQEDYSPEEAKQDALELWLLRLVDDRSMDLYQFYIDLLTEQVAGYYDPKKNELFVLGERSRLSPSARETLAHEFVHSLQDQHYDLEKLLPDETEDDDGSLAKRALVEGDATISGVLYAREYLTAEELQQLIEESSKVSTEKLDQAPTYLREALLFPYREGFDFVQELYGQGGFDRVNQAFTDPPTSTEQIIHPSKYTGSQRDNPKAITLTPLTDTLGTGWKRTDGGTFGEFDLKILLDENGAQRPNEAAAGWGGGQYVLYEGDGQGLLMFSTLWDTKKDADDFEAALRETFEAATPDGEMWSDEGRTFGIKRVGDQITLLASTDRMAAERALGVVK